uniref:Beta-2-glycoprotein 1 n=1 Tax=Geotrypetes seraphini TaxID=260995 RepID=A0A6P8SHD4_GEOSA|nr:beta-2-glycoprotein 1-like [Geotrypetes seraphini]
MGQTCQKSCLRHQDCSGKRRCLCDGLCGLSCITPSRTCPWPIQLIHAEVRLKGESHHFRDEMMVSCRPGFKMSNGRNATRSHCRGDRKWSPTPACQEVFCPPPREIENGHLVAVEKPRYQASEVIYYLCKRNFYLDGSNRVVCQKNGSWSEIPACRGRCKIPVQRSRIVYQGKKLWIGEVPEGEVQHLEEVTFFCRSQNQSCSYQVVSRCFDGHLPLPNCYREPTWVQYTIFPKKLVSEIPSC